MPGRAGTGHRRGQPGRDLRLQRRGEPEMDANRVRNHRRPAVRPLPGRQRSGHRQQHPGHPLDLFRRRQSAVAFGLICSLEPPFAVASKGSSAMRRMLTILLTALVSLVPWVLATPATAAPVVITNATQFVDTTGAV